MSEKKLGQLAYEAQGLASWDRIGWVDQQRWSRVEAAIRADEAAKSAARIVECERERDEARRALERDRSIVITTVNKIKETVSGRAWLLEGGRGPYSWDDDRFREEFSDALRAIEVPVEELRKIGRDWSNCPTDPDEIKKARTDWKVVAASASANARAEKAEAALRKIADRRSITFGPHGGTMSAHEAFGIADAAIKATPEAP